MALAALLLAGGEALADDEAKEAAASFYRAHFAFGSGFGASLKSSLKSIPAC